MIAVIFEVTPADGQIDEYLAIAARLREDLMTIEGFISIERFQSLTLPGKFCHSRFGKMKRLYRNGEKWRYTGKPNQKVDSRFLAIID